MNLFDSSFRRASRFAAHVVILGAVAIAWSTVAVASPSVSKASGSEKASPAKKAAVTKVKAKQVASGNVARAKTVKANRQAQLTRNKAGRNQLTAQSRGKTAAVASPSDRKLSAKQLRLAKTVPVVGVVKVSTRSSAAPHSSLMRMAAEAPVSTGARMGLRASADPLELSSSVALVLDQETNEVLFRKNDSAVLPIASLTKLMTGLVIADGNLPMDELITITQDDVDTFKGSRSRLAVGTTLTRGELMHLSLMSSENRAAHALGRTYPGGLQHFVSLMNAKARTLGMMDTRYVEPTGLMSQNQSSARDLATLVSVAYERPILRSLSTSPGHQVELGHRMLQYNNSNRLIHNPEWEIGLQKTGYISEAGRCLVMQAKVAGRKIIMVFLDSAGKLSRVEDAERVRRWVEAQSILPLFAPRPQG